MILKIFIMKISFLNIDFQTFLSNFRAEKNMYMIRSEKYLLRNMTQ